MHLLDSAIVKTVPFGRLSSSVPSKFTPDVLPFDPCEPQCASL